MYRSLCGRSGTNNTTLGKKVLYPALNETKKNALMGNLNSTYPVNKDFPFFLCFAFRFCPDLQH